jgi:hypothetical protein
MSADNADTANDALVSHGHSHTQAASKNNPNKSHAAHLLFLDPNIQIQPLRKSQRLQNPPKPRFHRRTTTKDTAHETLKPHSIHHWGRV